MAELIGKITSYLQYPFVRYALVTGVLIALCSSLLGVMLVLRHFSYIGDGLSHVAFGALSFAAVFGLTDKMVLVLPATILCAILLLCGGERRKIKGDSSIAMISVGALAVGYLLLNIFTPSTNLSGDVCSTLFGSTSILTLTRTEVILCVVLSLLAVGTFVLLYDRLFSVTFDEPFARATGMATGLYNIITAVIIAVIIVLAMNLVGSLLISALVIFPALSAMRVCKSFKGVTVCSAILSVTGAVLGLLISIVAGTPVGATIVAVDMAIFLCCSCFRPLALLVCAAAALSSCTPASRAHQPQQSTAEKSAVDVDLTTLSATMTYAEVFSMLVEPERYEGKTVRMRGQFYEVDTPSGEPAFACIVQDATACCAQGLTFVLAGEHEYPADYPALNETITVTGTFHCYEKDGLSFFDLVESSLETAAGGA